MRVSILDDILVNVEKDKLDARRADERPSMATGGNMTSEKHESEQCVKK